jgi:peptidoglycan/LPS O-acetylase OafA/YrhL
MRAIPTPPRHARAQPGHGVHIEGDPRRLAPLAAAWFALYGCFTQAWFMGTLFFLSGLLAAGALARRGPGRFARERLFRLGAPLLLFMLVIHPLTVYAFYDHGRLRHTLGLARFYAGFLLRGKVLSASGPLWFVEALLGFCLVYALFRALRPAPAAGARTAPGSGVLLLLALGIGAGAFLIRLDWPIGSSFGFLQPCFFASYLVLFGLGIHAGERGWLEALPWTSARRWLTTGLLGIPVFFLLMAASGARSGGPLLWLGGRHWQAAAYALWEGLVAMAMTLGLVGWFRRHGAWDNRFTRACAAHSFRLYVFHTPVLVGLAVALAAWHAPLLAKHAVVAPLAILATLALAQGLGRVPGLAAITR